MGGARRPRGTACPEGRTAEGGGERGRCLDTGRFVSLRLAPPARAGRPVRDGVGKSSGYRNRSAEPLAGLAPAARRPGVLPGPLPEGELISGTASRLDAFSGYPRRTRLPGHAVGRQPVHRRSVHPGPLVLGAASLDSPAPAGDRDRTVSRRSEPSSRTALGPAPAPGCDEPTSRCQTLPSMWTLGQDQPVIPGVPFIR